MSNKVGEVWRDFSQNTGFHGVNKLSIVQPGNKFRILIWVCVIVSCSAYLTYTLIKELQNYYEYPTTMKMFSQPEKTMEFPAVTVCNLNSLKKSAMKEDSRVDDYYMSLSPLSNFAHVNWNDTFYKDEGFYENQTMEDILKDHKTILGKFVFLALFDIRPLDINKYFSVKITSNGPCMTTNPSVILKTSQTGSTFNLNMWFNVDSANNYYGKWMSEGIMFTIHDRNEEPEFDSSHGGYYVQPGTEVFAAVKKRRFEYLPAPYEAIPKTYCRESKNNDDDGYRISACYKDCFTRYIYNLCNCIHFTNKNKYYCSKYVESTCIQKAMVAFTNYTNILDLCDCPLPCKYTKYEATVTSSVFPSDVYSKLFFERFFGNDLKYHRENYISLHLYFEQLSTTVSKQIPVYSSAGDIFANLGGQMGLFLGASIVTFTELGEFIFSMLWILFNKLKNKNRKSQNLTTAELQAKTKNNLSAISTESLNE